MWFKKLLAWLFGGTGELPNRPKAEEFIIDNDTKKITIKPTEETPTVVVKNSEKEDITTKKGDNMYDWKTIDWDDKKAKVADNFTVHETLWLPSWRIYHIPSDEEKQEIVKTADAMQKVRNEVNASVIVHVWIRPLKVNNPDSSYHGENYNLAIGSKATKSAHIFGKACDFHVSGKSGLEGCAEVRQIIIPHLEEWDIRMEDITGAWVHIDTNPVGNKRFYKP